MLKKRELNVTHARLTGLDRTETCNLLGEDSSPCPPCPGMGSSSFFFELCSPIQRELFAAADATLLRIEGANF